VTRLGLLLPFSTMLAAAACTETPGYLPPCVDPQMDPCTFDAGLDGDATPDAHKSDREDH
jgi:hypothetical protein